MSEADSSVHLDKCYISTRSEKNFETVSEFLIRKGNVTLDYYTQKIHCFYSLNDESEDVNINNIDKKNLDSLDKQFININDEDKLKKKGYIKISKLIYIINGRINHINEHYLYMIFEENDKEMVRNRLIDELDMMLKLLESEKE